MYLFWKNTRKNNFLLILCIFNYNHYGKIFMFSAFNSALTTVHQGNPKYLHLLYIYTQGVSLYLRHTLKSKLIHKIPTRHCKQSHARSYDYSTTPQQNIITWLKEIIISYIFSFNDIVTIIRLDLHIHTSFVILPRIVQFTWKSKVLFQHILSKTVIAN